MAHTYIFLVAYDISLLKLECNFRKGAVLDPSSCRNICLERKTSIAKNLMAELRLMTINILLCVVYCTLRSKNNFPKWSKDTSSEERNDFLFQNVSEILFIPSKAT